jgi:hypothetical protein
LVGAYGPIDQHYHGRPFVSRTSEATPRGDPPKAGKPEQRRGSVYAGRDREVRSRGMVEQREAPKARGRNRITGNLSVQSRPLAPPQHHPRIAIAGDIPPGSCKSSGRQIDYTVASAASSLSRRLAPLKKTTPPAADRPSAGEAVWAGARVSVAAARSSAAAVTGLAATRAVFPEERVVWDPERPFSQNANLRQVDPSAALAKKKRTR